MKRLLIILLLLMGQQVANAQASTCCELISGEVKLIVDSVSPTKFNICFDAFGKQMNADATHNPTLMLDCAGGKHYVAYNAYEKDDEALILTADVRISAKVSFLVTDTFEVVGNGAFTLSRSINVTNKGTSTSSEGFYSSFGIMPDTQNELLDYDYFLPSVLYSSYFTEAGNIPSGIPTASSTSIQYRDDRTPLPVIMMRQKETGLTLTLVETNSPCTTILTDALNNTETSSEYQYGGTGIVKRSNTNAFAAVVTYPGSDERSGGLGVRRHPVSDGFSDHNYSVYFQLSETENYASAVKTAWDKAVELYNPKIYAIDLQHAFDAILASLDYYYLSPTGDSNFDYNVKQPGFPWSVKLSDFSLDATTYEIGFVGMQTEAGYALFHEGLLTNNSKYRDHGTKVLNFWASKCLSNLGFPKSRFYSISGQWDNAVTTLRQACTGMSALLNAWCFAKKHGVSHSTWLTACKRFGQWLLKNQNEDGSYFMEYNPMTISGGKHPVTKDNKHLTICSIRYLVELYLATDEEAYKEAAMRAAEFCYENIHKQYAYVACIIDNPQTIDSESGQQALQSFLSMYDLTKDEKWLEAAKQAATYTESWVYMHEIPVENDQTGETDWPKDRSVVGQHILTVGQPACDLGFAWSSFCLYRLYLYTGDEHYLLAARISAHNSKQSMNLGQELYPEQPEGLQQEACTLRSAWKCPRRTNSIMEALTWNFAAHLDPMIRFQDAFGSVDIEAIEQMPKEEVLQMNERYSFVQQSDYGQIIDGIKTRETSLSSPRYFNLQGQQLSSPAKSGISIFASKDKVFKIMNK